MARIDGEVIFIPGVIAGEKCVIRIVNIGKTAAHGVLETLTEPSPHRVEPDCPYFGRCGGCNFRHMDYDEELRLKRQRVRDALERIGGCSVPELEITGAAVQNGYRNKVQFPVAQQKCRAVAGFYRARTHEVIPADGCKLQPECAERLKKAVTDWMRENRVPAYDEKTHTGCVRHIYLRLGFVSGQALCCVVLNAKKTPQPAALVEAILREVPQTAGIVVSYNVKRGNTILGDRFETLYGSDTIEDTLCGLRFRLSARSFYQVNHDQAGRLYDAAVRLTGLTEKDSVLDLYCGAGTITLCLARHAGKAYGVEIIDAAIRDARENAARNGLENTEFFCADAGEAALEFARRGVKLDVIVVDPPRKGVSRDVIAAMLEMAPKRIVYVSCDPATLARDVKLLREGGYALTHAEAFDLFPRCAHVETVCLLSKLNTKQYIEVELNLDELDLTAAESKATYEEIKAYVLEHTGLKVSSLYIAQVKQKHGIIERENYNKPKSEDTRQPQCPPEKEKAITEALKHFGMI